MTSIKNRNEARQVGVSDWVVEITADDILNELSSDEDAREQEELENSNCDEKAYSWTAPPTEQSLGIPEPTKTPLAQPQKQLTDDKDEFADMQEVKLMEQIQADRKASIYKSFTVGEMQKSISLDKPSSSEEQAEKESSSDDGDIDLEDIMKEDSDDVSDESNQDGEQAVAEDVSPKLRGQEENDQGNDSLCSDQDILNRSLQSDEDGEIFEATNFLRYANERTNQKLDILEIVDKNERSFKQVAEKMIQKSSQLEQPSTTNTLERRLMHMKNFKGIADRFFGDLQVAQGVPYSITALEDFVAIGSSDGSVRLFDYSEQEIKMLLGKDLKGNAVTCLDMKRCFSNKNIFIATGHAKGQVALYEVKGLLKQHEFIERQRTKDAFTQIQDDLFGNVSFKHQKTIDDIHKTTVVQLKFVGNFEKECLVLTCDLSGIVYMTAFVDGLMGYSANKQCLMQKRLGAVYTLAPLITIVNRADTNYAYQKVVETIQLKREEKVIVSPFHTQKAISEQKQRASIVKVTNSIGIQICAFGSLDEVYVAVIKPKANALLSIARPAYIQAGTVSYMDWGKALTPTFRDQAYPVLAIAWGRTIQLVVYTNETQAEAGKEDTVIQLDGFYICDAFSIDSCFFLSESLLCVLVNKKEVRILYTQNFTPGVFDSNYASTNLRSRKIGGDSNAEDQQEIMLNFTKLKEKYAGQVSAYAEKDKGYRLLEEEIRHKDNHAMMTPGEIRSKYNFNPTICKNHDFNIIALGKTTIGQRNLIHWEEYLDLIRRTNPDDWLKVLRAALEIFNGKMVGLAGLPDSREKREVMLRERMKDLLSQNIDACIKEFQEGECVSRKTLRVAAEFCIKVGAIDHLFGELFSELAEAGMEQRYFENLDAFILSGKLKNVRVPDKILQRLIDFYRQKDVELLEKAILNLDLSKYPHVTNVRTICEEEFLSSALIHLLTTLFDEGGDQDTSTCLSILCALFNLMMRCQVAKTKEDVLMLTDFIEAQGCSIFESLTEDEIRLTTNNAEELKKSEDFKEKRRQKLEIEHSRAYIGYKLLWVIALFLEGKKFPQGSLSSFKWRCYVYDIVRFCTNERFVQWFFDFDPESFFQILKKLYLDPEPFEYIKTQDVFLNAYKNNISVQEPCPSHEDILEILRQNVQRVVDSEKAASDGRLTAKAEAVQNAFMFFVTQVARNRKFTIPVDLCIKTLKDQIQFHKKLVKLPKKQLEELIPKTQTAKKVKDRMSNIYAYLIKRNERDILQLVHRQTKVFSQDQIRDLLEEAETAPLFKLKVLLYQLLGNYQKCLQLFFQIKAIKADIFTWLNEVQSALVDNVEPRKTLDLEENEFDMKSLPTTISFQKMKELIMQNVADFVDMDPSQTVKLCEEWFQSDYFSIAEALKDQKDLAFSFLNTVVQQNEAKIVEEYNNSLVHAGGSQKFAGILLRLVYVLCDKKYRQRKIVEFVSRNYFPIDESLVICEREGATEACAVLQKRKGQYKKSVELYVKVLVSLSAEQLPYAFLVEPNIEFNDPAAKNKHIIKFDEILLQMIRICEKYGSRLAEPENTELWLFSIKGLYGVKSEVEKLTAASSARSDSDDLSDLETEGKPSLAKFLMIRNQAFMQKMSEHVNLRTIIAFLEEIGHEMKYQEFKATFEAKIKNENYFEAIMNNAKILVDKDLTTDFQSMGAAKTKGAVNTYKMCNGCQSSLVTKFDDQELWLFPQCNHAFHARCVAKTEGQCSVCFNEFQVLYQLKTRTNTQRRGQRTRRDSNASDHSSRSSAAEKDDEFELARKKTVKSLQKSKETKVGRKKSKIETKEERLFRQMAEFESEQNQKTLDLDNFTF